MLFVEILNNYLIYNKNAKLIENGLLNKKLNFKQYEQLKIDNLKWYETCNHKGLLFKEGPKYYLATRTSKDKALELPNEFFKYKNYQESIKKQYAEPLTFNTNCKIINKKGVLGDNSKNQIEYRSLEEEPQIVSKLVGSNEDLIDLKIGVKTLNLTEYDISSYFNLEHTIDELDNSYIIKDE